MEGYICIIYNVQACAVMKCYRPNILIIKQKKERMKVEMTGLI
jgi:hypothetical protein